MEEVPFFKNGRKRAIAIGTREGRYTEFALSSDSIAVLIHVRPLGTLLFTAFLF